MPTRCQDLCQGWVGVVNKMRSVSMSVNSDVCTCGDGVWTILLARPAGVGRGGRGAFTFHTLLSELFIA